MLLLGIMKMLLILISSFFCSSKSDKIDADAINEGVLSHFVRIVDLYCEATENKIENFETEFEKFLPSLNLQTLFSNSDSNVLTEALINQLRKDLERDEINEPFKEDIYNGLCDIYHFSAIHVDILPKREQIKNMIDCYDELLSLRKEYFIILKNLIEKTKTNDTNAFIKKDDSFMTLKKKYFDLLEVKKTFLKNCHQILFPFLNKFINSWKTSDFDSKIESMQLKLAAQSAYFYGRLFFSVFAPDSHNLRGKLCYLETLQLNPFKGCALSCILLSDMENSNYFVSDFIKNITDRLKNPNLIFDDFLYKLVLDFSKELSKTNFLEKVKKIKNCFSENFKKALLQNEIKEAAIKEFFEMFFTGKCMVMDSNANISKDFYNTFSLILKGYYSANYTEIYNQFTRFYDLLDESNRINIQGLHVLSDHINSLCEDAKKDAKTTEETDNVESFKFIFDKEISEFIDLFNLKFEYHCRKNKEFKILLKGFFEVEN